MKKVKSLNKISIKDIKIVSLLIFLSALLRFINYPNRWGLAYDQSHFAILSKYALENNMLPLLGPFSSGGPFQTGGEWYWIVMLGELMYPFSILSPWIFITLLTVLAIIPLYLIGVLLKGRILGVFIGILAVVSPVQILQSTNLTNQTPIILFSSLSILFMVLYFTQQKAKYIFLQSLMIGLASSVHIQGVALIPLLLFTIILNFKKSLKMFHVVAMGLFIPWFPVFVSDYSNNFYNTKSMLTYFFSEQAKVPYEVLGRRWLTFATIFFPSSWGKISGGFGILGYIGILLVGTWFMFSFLKRKISKFEWAMLLSFGVMVIILRYTRTPLFDSFFIFLHPVIYILLACAIYLIFKIKKIAGLLILFIILSGSLIDVWGDVWNATNVTAPEARRYVKKLKEEYPEEKFVIFDHSMKTNSKSYPLVMYLYNEHLLGSDGVMIGLSIATETTTFQNDHKAIYGMPGDYQLFDLNASSSSQLVEAGWARIEPQGIYNSVQRWYEE